jgi:hypothetical protein
MSVVLSFAEVRDFPSDEEFEFEQAEQALLAYFAEEEPVPANVQEGLLRLGSGFF